MIIKNAHVFGEDGYFTQRDIYIDGDTIARDDQDKYTEEMDADGCYAIPGLIDVHQHGSVRFDYCGSTAEQMMQMAEYQAANGITAVCATTMTMPEEVLSQTCEQLKLAAGGAAAEFVGINLEGPFISPNKAGAQNPAYIQPPDAAMYRRLQERSGGMVKLLAVAPEMEGALELIREVFGEVRCSIAHTTAGYDLALEAFKAGARQVTHLYNAMPPFLHRDPGVIGAACDTPECMVELITDNVHIHPSVVRATFRMFGGERIIFVSDSMMATGLHDGEYELGGLGVSVRGNTARLTEGGAIAGSVTNLMDCLRTAVKVMDIPLEDAVRCATINPAKAIGVFHSRGSITPGKIADIVLLNPDLSIRQVILRGRRVLD